MIKELLHIIFVIVLTMKNSAKIKLLGNESVLTCGSLIVMKQYCVLIVSV